MSEDPNPLNTRGRHTGYETAELDPIDDGLIANDDVDLESDPFAEDLSAELAARAPRRYATRTTAVLAGLVLAVGGFLAGAQVQKHFGTPAAGSTQNRSGSAGAGSGFAAGGSFGGGNSGGRNSGGQRQGAPTAQPSATSANVTTGTVKLVDGGTVYVQTADGNVVTVRTNGTTSVQITQSGALTDLAPGAQVSVEGSASGDGVVTATKVTKAR
jgi:hypothetical protein